jgi:endonuclease G
MSLHLSSVYPASLYPHHHLYRQAGPYDHLLYLVSVDYIEQLTGLNFLTSLPNNIKNQIESAVATSLW